MLEFRIRSGCIDRIEGRFRGRE